jgi:predicted lysophospholipase L1 biosynthesis ABC-type transport system permease subunit
MIGEQDHIRDITEIRSMMERSSKFLSLSGLAGVMAGIYALVGAYVAYSLFHFDAAESAANPKVYLLAAGILVLAVGTAIILSSRKARQRNERVWNATSRRLLMHMAVPLFTGGILILMFIAYGLIGLIIPMSLIFYGLALFNAGKFTFDEVKFLGIIQVALGLLSAYFTNYGLLFWALGFGVFHIVYGIYIHFRHER